MDDRSQAYRELFTRTRIREALDSFDYAYDRSVFIYECIELALESKPRHSIYHPRTLNVGNVLHEVLENRREK